MGHLLRWLVLKQLLYSSSFSYRSMQKVNRLIREFIQFEVIVHCSACRHSYSHLILQFAVLHIPWLSYQTRYVRNLRYIATNTISLQLISLDRVTVWLVHTDIYYEALADVWSSSTEWHLSISNLQNNCCLIFALNWSCHLKQGSGKILKYY